MLVSGANFCYFRCVLLLNDMFVVISCAISLCYASVHFPMWFVQSSEQETNTDKYSMKLKLAQTSRAGQTKRTKEQDTSTAKLPWEMLKRNLFWFSGFYLFAGCTPLGS